MPSSSAQTMSVPRLCSISFHTTSHTVEEVIFNPEIFGDFAAGDLVQICDPAQAASRLVVRVPLNKATGANRLEVSVLKSISEAIGFKQFGRVLVDRISEEDASLDFVELSFRRQYLQRGNMFRFKCAFIGRTVHMNQNIAINSIQGQIQDLRSGSSKKLSGLVTQHTKFVFRSKSSRVIWLVQISAEMWDFDMNGDLYFEKFLNEFASPVLDSWKSLGVSHMLTVIFFCRTFFLDRVALSSHPELYAKKSFAKNSNGFYQQDFFKIVIENIADIDKMAQIKVLRQQFWEFAQCVGWRACKDPEREMTSRMALNGGDSATSADGLQSQKQSQLNYVLPSDAVHGNVLEAINSTLNILEKHYMDRDLQRTGNSIVLISVGSGLFKVKPNLAQITKQRMLDNAFGIDFISLSRPPVHAVPLFLVDCKAEGFKDFYEMPHWIRVSYVDCKTHPPLSGGEGEVCNEYYENWSSIFVPPPLSSVLTATLMNADDLRSLTIGYVKALPTALTQYISFDNTDGMLQEEAPVESVMESALKPLSPGVRCSTSSLPMWGTAPIVPFTTKRYGEGFSSKSVFYQRDLLNLKAVALSRSPPFNKRLYVEIFESLPAMRHEYDNTVAESYSSDEDSHMGKSYDNSSLDSFLFDGHGNLTERSAFARTSATKHALLDATFQLKKLRDEALLSDDMTVEKLEDLFFQHDALVFKPLTPTTASTPSAAPPSAQQPIPIPSFKQPPSGNDRRRQIGGMLNKAPTRPPNKEEPPLPVPSVIVGAQSQLSGEQSNVAIDSQAASRSKLSSRNFVARNQVARNMQTKMALVQGSNVPAGGGAETSSKKTNNVEYLQDYCKHYGINPFRQKEGKKYLSIMSHNRRRWSHVFPQRKVALGVDYGLNWKSLTQPAILPLNTDYLPSVADLRDKFTVHQYTIQFLKDESPFETLEDALQELVCQRLSQEFQLIEGLDQSPYMRLNNYDIFASNSSAPRKVTEVKKEFQKPSNKHFFILTMGHRIQFLYGDTASSQICVTQYVSNRGKNNDDRTETENDKTSFTYRYEMWMPQRDRFETIVQSFYQFPLPELRWNLIDNIIAGGLTYDDTSIDMKTRRLKFIVIPQGVRGVEDVESYYTQMDFLLDFFRKYLAKDEKISVTKDYTLSTLDSTVLEPTHGAVSHNMYPAIYRQTSREGFVARLVMRGPKHANPNWIYIRYDRYLYGFKAFHFEVHWKVCDSWLVDDFVSLLYRRCSKWALRLVQIPEYFTTSNLSVHPFKALPYLQLPDSSKVHAMMPSPVRLLERSLFGRSQGWIFDSEQTTEWSRIGITPPNYTDRDRDLLALDCDALIASAAAAPSDGSAVPTAAAVTAAAPKQVNSWSRSFQRMVFKQPDGETAAGGAVGVETAGLFGPRSAKLDRQYVHVSGLAVVRVAANGFVWMQNAIARIADPAGGSTPTEVGAPQRPLMALTSADVWHGRHGMTMSSEDKKTFVTTMMHRLEGYCTAGAECYEIVLSVVEEALRQASSLHISVEEPTSGSATASPMPAEVSPNHADGPPAFSPIKFTSSHI